MKNILFIILISTILSSCNSEKKSSFEDVLLSNNLSEIRTERDKIVQQQQELHQKIDQLDEKIALLDTLKKVPLITTIKVQEDNFKHYIELQGSVQTKQNIIIYPESAGTLLQVFVKEGQYVKKGQLLAKVDDGGLSQQLAQLEVQTNFAKTTFERQERLWQQNIGSEIQYLQAKTNYESNQKAVKQLQSLLSKSNIKAPFSGTIDDVITEQGTVVAPGQTPIFRIVNLSNMYIETDVPENYISKINKNTEALIYFPVLAKQINSKIRQVSNYINPTNRTFKIEIEVPNKNKDIKPNLTAKLKLNDYNNSKAIRVPQSIISENAQGEQYLYIIEKNKNNKIIAKKILVKTGKTQGDEIEVLEGLHQGDQVIKEGARTVRDGQEVKIIN
ncbi:MAG: efflux RND transporter periplasmic adaptor subunit [Flavobacteriales bacterium]